MEDQEHPLKLYDSLTREVRTFVPQDPTRVTMYNCGPTVYSYAHIGNARAAVVADVLFRVLRHIYGEDHVRYARNLTDVDDKIIASAQEQGVPISEITEKYARIYNEDLAALNCLMPTVQPKATEHIQQMADIIVTLMDKDVAYEADGYLYFDVTKDDDYGKLSGRSLDDNQAGARVDVVTAKRNAADFVLWKPAKDGEPGWSQQESSSTYAMNWRHYGNQLFATTPGRPGWHIECSAMAKETLGETIDIHCGGIDLKFPHHENEIAQSETANEETFARYWVHNEFLNMGKDKMSKSLGNVVLVHDLLKEWDGEVIRLALLKAHYRNELIWSEDLLRESKAQLDGWYRKLQDAFPYLEKSTFQPTFFGSLTNDLKTSHHIAFAGNDISGINFDFGDLASRYGDLSDPEHEMVYALEMGFASLRSLGLLQRDPEDWFRGNASADETTEFDTLAAARHAARQAKDWAEADRIRDEGTARGIIFEDSPDGTTWRKV
ncbi:cysteine--tRNA ligase [Algimonas porphyrae]|uniref:Cysteine--tRNA ligase n=1 Tax=Algimonas porphyrae TaxID=1128113 RepID=A0ABQ5V3H3_9PROT|nr:cysteine--tRNA ligase [Algimonas porphyrae]GLQ22053.1 cysteine--tRNA ligase [Algimonas porphyrae]